MLPLASPPLRHQDCPWRVPSFLRCLARRPRGVWCLLLEGRPRFPLTITHMSNLVLLPSLSHPRLHPLTHPILHRRRRATFAVDILAPLLPLGGQLLPSGIASLPLDPHAVPATTEPTPTEAIKARQPWKATYKSKGKSSSWSLGLDLRQEGIHLYVCATPGRSIQTTPLHYCVLLPLIPVSGGCGELYAHSTTRVARPPAFVPSPILS